MQISLLCVLVLVLPFLAVAQRGKATWGTVETCAKTRVDGCIDQCIGSLGPKRSKAVKRCLEAKKEQAFNEYDVCLQNQGADKNTGCTTWGGPDDGSQFKSTIQQKINQNDVAAKRAYECFHTCSNPISQSCRNDCNSSLFGAIVSHGDKIKQCYHDVGQKQLDNFVVCLHTGGTSG